MIQHRLPTPRLSRWMMFVGFAAFAALSPGAWAQEYSDVTRLLRAGQAVEANAMLDKLLAAKPRDPQLRFLRGVVQSEQNKPNDAITTFTRLTEDFPELPEPYNNLAVLYAAQNQFDKARAALEMAIRTNPSYATAYENLGDVYAKLASQSYSKALQLDANNSGVQPKLNLIRELFAPGKPRPAAPVAAKPAPTPVATPAAPPVAPPAAPPVLAPPVASKPTPAPVAAPAVAAASGNSEIEAAVRDWAGAWSARDVSRYLAAYGKDFSPSGGGSRTAWESDRKNKILGKRKISVGLTDLQVSVSGVKATAKFRQDYNADSLSVQSRKTLEFARAGDKWVIVREGTGG